MFLPNKLDSKLHNIRIFLNMAKIWGRNMSLSISNKNLVIPIVINLLAPELFSLILAHPLYKMWIMQEPNTLDLWNELHFEEEKTESIYHV